MGASECIQAVKSNKANARISAPNFLSFYRQRTALKTLFISSISASETLFYCLCFFLSLLFDLIWCHNFYQIVTGFLSLRKSPLLLFATNLLLQLKIKSPNTTHTHTHTHITVENINRRRVKNTKTKKRPQRAGIRLRNQKSLLEKTLSDGTNNIYHHWPQSSFLVIIPKTKIWVSKIY